MYEKIIAKKEKIIIRLLLFSIPYIAIKEKMKPSDSLSSVESKNPPNLVILPEILATAPSSESNETAISKNIALNIPGRKMIEKDATKVNRVQKTVKEFGDIFILESNPAMG
jgi:hypothetical protein